MPKLFDKTFYIALGIFILTEILSIIGFFNVFMEKPLFILILLLTAVLGCIKYEFSVIVLISELIIGSKGYLFSWPITQESGISIRLGIFLIVFLIGLIKIIRDCLKKEGRFIFWYSKLRNYYFLIFIVIFWGVIWALIRKISPGDIFFDSNAYLYLGLAPILYQLITSKAQILNLLRVFLAATAHVCLKCFVLLYIFSHGLSFAEPLYHWVRDTGFGEITLLSGNFFRVFSQAQIYSLIGFFIAFALLISLKNLRTKNAIGLFIISASALSNVIFSLSRSFWVAAAGTFIILIGVMFFKYRLKIKEVSKIKAWFFSALTISVLLIIAVVKFPIPPVKVDLDALRHRFQISDEAAVSSRWSQLPELGLAIAGHPIIGSGFGQTVTYITSDPRLLSEFPDGKYTTFAFEWGYLDQILKFGLAGLVIYLLYIYKIWRLGWFAAKNAVKEFERPLILGLIFGLLALMATHMFSPYLNHPLGIGYLILIGIWFEILPIPVVSTSSQK
ncbi:MAG TPA: hypothetical protein VMX18_00600 [Candidatus Bipolaricaulota bacterium]|nr:hypothetical protein [Candidatus Bipolaricaulota bacterium]